MVLKINFFFVLLILLTNEVYADFASGSYVYLNVRDRNRNEEGQNICVNYQQFKFQNLPTTLQSAESLQLKWWNNVFNETDVCKKGNSRIFKSNDLVPALYRKDSKNTLCESDLLSYYRFMQYQFWLMKNNSVSNILFLVDKGKVNYNGYRDLLFSSFYNPEIPLNDSTKVFYIYQQLFYKKIFPLLTDSNKESLEFRFYRPPSWVINPTIVFMVFLSIGCILIGSLWAAKEVKKELYKLKIINISSEIDVPKVNFIVDENQLRSTEIGEIEAQNVEKEKQKNKKKQEIKHSSWWIHLVYAGCFFLWSTILLLLSFFFRNIAITFFNCFVLFLGTISIHACAYTIFQNFLFEQSLFSLSQIFCFLKSSKKRLFKKKIPLFSTLIFFISFAICFTWFWNRKQNEALILLDCINVFICIYAIKSSNIRCLQWISFVLILMFFYDLFMVFGSRLFTKTGCSIMIQVVTGTDCQNKDTSDNYILPPVDAAYPEKIPIMFILPNWNDPMSECVDTSIDTQLNALFLGLGDVILPGFLICYCFFVDVVKKHAYYKYGFIILFGYLLGMISTFASLYIMKVGQPALLYLVPFTLIPISLLSWRDGIFKQVWSGKFPELTPSNGESNPQN